MQKKRGRERAEQRGAFCGGGGGVRQRERRSRARALGDDTESWDIDRLARIGCLDEGARAAEEERAKAAAATLAKRADAKRRRRRSPLLHRDEAKRNADPPPLRPDHARKGRAARRTNAKKEESGDRGIRTPDFSHACAGCDSG